MARSLEGIKVALNMQATLENTINGGERTASVAQGLSHSPTKQTSGTSNNQSDRIWFSPGRTLTSGSSETIDVYDFGSLDIGGGAGKDALGQAMALAEINGLQIIVRATSTGSLVVGGDGTTACWNSLFAGDDDGKITLPPGAPFQVHCPSDPGWAVADTSNHLFKLEAVGGNVTFDITILGRSA